MRLRTGAFHVAMALLAVLWLAPIGWAVLTSVRTFDDLAANGVGSLPRSFSLAGYAQAWSEGGQLQALINSMAVTVPAVLLSLGLSAMAAFALARYRIPFRRTLLITMLAGNLLPPQILLVPVSKFAELTGLYDTLWALIAVHVGFGLGFYTFVLHGFLRELPGEIQEAATLDGAGVGQVFWRIMLPLTRPALAALGALSFTWIFNDLLWAITVLRTDSRMPVTPALLALQGQYVSSWSVIAAGTVIAAVPTLAVFLRFQRHFVGGLALGAVK